MDFSEKNKIKDILILSLIDSLAEIYSVNLNIDKDVIYDSIVSKLTKFDILDVNTKSINIENAKNKLVKYITTDITNDLQLYNPNRTLSFFSNFQNSELIGKGGNGWVYKVFNPLDKSTYAIKKIGIKSNFSESLNEVRAMAKFNNKNIVRYYNSWIESRSFDEKINLINSQLLITDKSDDSTNNSDWEELNEENYNKFLFIQMELCKCNLKEYLKDNDITIKERKNICLQILKGINYIHKNKYMHRDIKLTNIFYGFDKKIKIGDFGLICKNDILKEDVGTIGYTAPEVLNGENYDYKADLYSLGVVFLEIFYDVTTNMEKMELIRKAKVNNLENDDINIQKLVNGLISNEPDKRLLIEDCIFLL